MNGGTADSFDLATLDVATPCTANWADMEGDDRVRRCAQCELDVYNVSNLTTDEVQHLVRQREHGRVCIRLLRRHDGTIITRDCPVGLQMLRRGLRKTVFALCVLFVVLVLAPLAAIASPFRLLGKADPFQRLRGWMKPIVAKPLCVVPAQPNLPALMGDVAMPLTVAPNFPPPQAPNSNAPPSSSSTGEDL